MGFKVKATQIRALPGGGLALVGQLVDGTVETGAYATVHGGGAPVLAKVIGIEALRTPIDRMDRRDTDFATLLLILDYDTHQRWLRSPPRGSPLSIEAPTADETTRAAPAEAELMRRIALSRLAAAPGDETTLPAWQDAPALSRLVAASDIPRAVVAYLAPILVQEADALIELEHLARYAVAAELTATRLRIRFEVPSAPEGGGATPFYLDAMRPAASTSRYDGWPASFRSLMAHHDVYFFHDDDDVIGLGELGSFERASLDAADDPSWHTAATVRCPLTTLRDWYLYHPTAVARGEATLAFLAQASGRPTPARERHASTAFLREANAWLTARGERGEDAAAAREPGDGPSPADAVALLRQLHDAAETEDFSHRLQAIAPWLPGIGPENQRFVLTLTNSALLHAYKAGATARVRRILTACLAAPLALTAARPAFEVLVSNALAVAEGLADPTLQARILAFLVPPVIEQPRLAFNVASAHAVMRQRDAMLSAMRLALRLGRSKDGFRSDAAFAPYHDDPEFQRLLA